MNLADQSINHLILKSHEKLSLQADTFFSLRGSQGLSSKIDFMYMCVRVWGRLKLGRLNVPDTN